MRRRERHTKRGRRIHTDTHTEHRSERETMRERKTEMLKAKKDRVERQLPPVFCSDLSAEAPGQTTPPRLREGLD